jgi:hypothetical protein
MWLCGRSEREIIHFSEPLSRIKPEWHAQLKAYKIITDSELLDVHQVSLSIPLEKLLSRPGYRVICETCGEEVINEREVILNGSTLCRGCAGQRYYRLTAQDNCPLLPEYAIYHPTAFNECTDQQKLTSASVSE